MRHCEKALADEAIHKSNQKWIATTYLRGLAMTKEILNKMVVFQYFMQLLL